MRGGRFQAKSNEDANMRNAEALFEAKTVGEIREVEVHTRREIEEKKEELRQLVGASYRDLIESADSILLMKQSCEAVADNISKMETGFDALKKSVSVNVSSPAADQERKRREKLYEVGSRVKYLVDTPEKIWGCLDEHMYLEGAERYLRAREVHSHLTGIGAKELLANFPLLQQQWPLIETFRAQISQRSKERLQESGLPVGDYAVALAASGIIDELNSAEIFSLFLESRKMWLRLHLGTWVQEKKGGITINVDGPHGDGHTGLVASALCKLVHMIQASLCQVGVLFLEVSTGKMPLLYSTVLAAPPASQLFGGIPNPEQELSLWKLHREKLEGGMMSLTGAFITDACVKWLQECAKDISEEARPLISHLRNGQELAEVETLVREDLAKHEALAESLGWLQSTFGGAIDSPWDCVCELLLKAPTNLWDTLFEGLFVGRMKMIVNSGFEDIHVKKMVAECLDSALKLGLSPGIAPEEQSLSTGNVVDLTTNGFRWKSNTVETEWDGDARFFFTAEVTEVKEKVDESLRLILRDLVTFLQGPHVQLRMDLLAPYLQDQCFKWVSTVAKDLQVQLSELSQSMLNAAADVAITALENTKHALEGSSMEKICRQALFLGRLSAALGQHSTSLPVLLGSPILWSAKEIPLQQLAGKGSLNNISRRVLWSEASMSSTESPARWFSSRGAVGQAAIPNAEDGATKLRELQRRLRQQSIAAHQMWIQWSTNGLVGSLLRDVQNDECFSTSTPLKGWEQTVIKSRGEDGEEVEARISLPAMPSPYVVAFLFAGCREIHGVGGHVLDRAVLELFAWQLLEKVLTVYEKFVSDSSFMNSRVSEKGLLQLLFDLKLLADVLSGGKDVSLENVDGEENKNLMSSHSVNSTKVTSQPAVKTDAVRKKWTASLLNNLQNRLDPIDWATYESYLWEQERQYYQRCAVLFGSLIQLQRLYKDNGPKLPSTADTNTLNMSATVPRFTYLPISAPIFSVQRASPRRSRRSSAQEDSDLGWRTSTNSDDSSAFSFSDSPSQISQGSARPLLQSLMGQMGQVGSKFGEGTLKLVLSDGQVGRFKDKSAAAISTFGDMLPLQASGLFQSLTSGATKQDSQDRMYY